MPVEIKKLIVKAVVETEPAAAPSSGAEPTAVDLEALTEACVKQVLQILKQSKKR